MKPWDTVRREFLGAWRSVRYDLDHRSKADCESKANVEAGTRAATGPAIGFDGASAPVGFGGPGTPVGFGGPGAVFGGEADSRYGPPLLERESIWAPLRDPRRLMSALAVASVIAASATGTFLAVTGGLGILLADSSGAPVAPQPAPASSPRVVTSATPRHRQVPASHGPSPSTSPSARVSATPTAHPSGTAKPAPSVAVTAVPPSYRPGAESSSSTTVSHSPSPSATPSAEPTP